MFRAGAAFRETKSAAEIAPRTGRFVRAAGLAMFIQEAGPAGGDPVLFIHGTGAWSEMWREQMTALAAIGFHCIALDLPPFGFSERPAEGRYGTTDQAARILGVLEALRIEGAVLVGHSFGARATVQAALSSPERVRALVLIDPALEIGSAKPESAIARTMLGVRPVREALVSATAPNPLLTKKLLESLIRNRSAATPERVRMLQRPLVRAGTTREVALWLAGFLAPEPPSRSTAVASYEGIRIPVLLVWGSADEITPIDLGKRLAILIPGAELSVIPGAGHIPYIEDPVRTTEALRRFLAAHPRPR